MKHQDIFQSSVCKIFCSVFQWKLCTPVRLSQIIGGDNKAYLSLSLLTAMKRKLNCSQVPRTSLLKINITCADYTKLCRRTNLLKTREQKVLISINFCYLKQLILKVANSTQFLYTLQWRVTQLAKIKLAKLTLISQKVGNFLLAKISV